MDCLCIAAVELSRPGAAKSRWAKSTGGEFLKKVGFGALRRVLPRGAYVAELGSAGRGVAGAFFHPSPHIGGIEAHEASEFDGGHTFFAELKNLALCAAQKA